jgi:hypothetical protein
MFESASALSDALQDSANGVQGCVYEGMYNDSLFVSGIDQLQDPLTGNVIEPETSFVFLNALYQSTIAGVNPNVSIVNSFTDLRLQSWKVSNDFFEQTLIVFICYFAFSRRIKQIQRISCKKSSDRTLTC